MLRTTRRDRTPRGMQIYHQAHRPLAGYPHRPPMGDRGGGVSGVCQVQRGRGSSWGAYRRRVAAARGYRRIFETRRQGSVIR